ncbi:ATP-dependent DNA helicase [Prunus yedoensis var. nudiflora]|uniref:ATP-dependent DNA helicase n=1 Tax=Prunus yedoensis var. nudiflora TaxID=2094558 RepID=A0A314Y1W0_PRUYE|nr:ATP-dependent DNA helicase [Prunus yedoensis var. nudiflora]
MALLLPIPGPSNSRWSEEATAISPGFRLRSRPGSTLWGVFLSLHPYKNAKNRGRRRGQVRCWVPNAVYTHSHTQVVNKEEEEARRRRSGNRNLGLGGSEGTRWRQRATPYPL